MERAAIIESAKKTVELQANAVAGIASFIGEDFAKAQRRYSEALVRTVNAVAKLRQLTSGRYPENLNY